MTDAAQKIETHDDDDFPVSFDYDGSQEAAPEEDDEQQAEPAEQEQEGGDPDQPADGDIDTAAFNEKQQAIFDEAMKRKTERLYKEKQRAEELERKVQELQSKIPQDQRPEVPPVPNMYDPQYEQKLRAREDALRKQVEWDAREQQRTAALVQRQQEMEYQQAMVMQERVNTYAQRAQAAGIKPETLQQAGAFVGSIIQNPEIVSHILEDDAGPSITMYLGRNPQEAEAVAQMSPTKAAIYLETKVKPKATNRKSPPPPPPTTLRGKGAAEEEDGPPGARYE